MSLYPNALPSTTSHAFDLSLAGASSTHYTQTVMTVVAVVFVPIVLAVPGLDLLGLPPPSRTR